MKIHEIVKETAPATAQQPAAEPTQADMAKGQELLGSIDDLPPEQAVSTISGWLKNWPVLDRVTDLLPQTRLIKAVASAIDAVQAGDPKAAITALASGGLGKGVQQAAQLTNTGTALAAGDVTGAALAAGGSAAKAATVANVGQNLAQNNLQGAAQAAGGTVAKAANLAAKVPAVQAAMPIPQQQTASNDLDRIKKLSGQA